MEKHRYNNFKTSDFILDEDFQTWVKGNKPEHNKYWEEWLKNNPMRAPEIDKAREILLALNFNEESIDSKMLNAEWEKLKIQKSDKTITLPDKGSNQRKKAFPWLLKTAAAITLLLVSYFSLKQFARQETKIEKVAAITKKVVEGQKLTITLADGTNIKLNAGSTISYPEKFSPDKRELKLTGEAFFKVAPNADAPFIVRTGNIFTTVLGTSFNINAYPENEEVLVAVVEGKVRVNSHDPSKNIEAEVHLTHNELATVPKNESEILVTGFDASELLAWKEGILNFGQSDFEEVVNNLERWYGVKFIIDENKNFNPEWRFNGKFQNRSLEYILGVFSYPERFSFQIDGNNVFIN